MRSSSTASIGIAFGTLDHTSPEQVLRDADYAMYQAKANGHARHEVFDGSMHVHVAAQMRKEQDLKDGPRKERVRGLVSADLPAGEWRNRGL